MKKNNDYLTYRTNKEFIEGLKHRNYGKVSSDEISEITEQIKSIESLSQNKQSTIFLLSLDPFKLLHVSPNVKDKLGYEQEEILSDDGKGIFRMFAESSLDFPTTVFNWSTKMKERINTVETDLILYQGGVKLKAKSGEISKYFFRLVSLAHHDSKISLVLYFAEDINHLMKSDMYWAYFIVGKERKYERFFSTNTGENGLENMVTKREKEILTQIDLGKRTKDIATLLDISVNTVERHRKNMIAKLGAKDSTALLQLCKMCGVL